MEDQLQAFFLGLVQFQDAGQQDRSESVHAGAHRDALALAYQAEDFDRIGARSELVAQFGQTGCELVRRLGRLRQAGQIALDVGQEYRNAGHRELFCHGLQCDGLAGARGAGNQAVAVEHLQRQADLGGRLGLAVDQRSPSSRHADSKA